jgi:hypothetical protein
LATTGAEPDVYPGLVPMMNAWPAARCGDRYFDFKDDYKGQIHVFRLVFDPLRGSQNWDCSRFRSSQRDHERCRS